MIYESKFAVGDEVWIYPKPWYGHISPVRDHTNRITMVEFARRGLEEVRVMVAYMIGNDLSMDGLGGKPPFLSYGEDECFATKHEAEKKRVADMRAEIGKWEA